MSEGTIPTQAKPGVPDRWTQAQLIEPSTAGFVHVGASSGAWRLPVALPRARRRAILVQLRAAAATMRRDRRVVRADVFGAFLRPPGEGARGAQGAPDADFDAVLLVETTTLEDATDLVGEHLLTGLLTALRQTAARTLAFAGSNPRRIGPVDHDRQGVFLFNYFSADDVDTNIFAWQYTAGWFQDQTGLDNSTILQPADPQAVPYSLVNHCRWIACATSCLHFSSTAASGASSCASSGRTTSSRVPFSTSCTA